MTGDWADLYLDVGNGIVHIDSACPVREETEVVSARGTPTKGFRFCADCLARVQAWTDARLKLAEAGGAVSKWAGVK